VTLAPPAQSPLGPSPSVHLRVKGKNHSNISAEFEIRIRKWSALNWTLLNQLAGIGWNANGMDMNSVHIPVELILHCL